MDQENPKRANSEVTCDKGGGGGGGGGWGLTFHLVVGPNWKRKGKSGGKRTREKKKKRRGKRDSSFYLVFPKIRLSAFFGVRGKVRPRGESFK